MHTSHIVDISMSCYCVFLALLSLLQLKKVPQDISLWLLLAKLEEKCGHLTKVLKLLVFGLYEPEGLKTSACNFW